MQVRQLLESAVTGGSVVEGSRKILVQLISQLQQLVCVWFEGDLEESRAMGL